MYWLTWILLDIDLFWRNLMFWRYWFILIGFILIVGPTTGRQSHLKPFNLKLDLPLYYSSLAYFLVMKIFHAIYLSFVVFCRTFCMYDTGSNILLDNVRNLYSFLKIIFQKVALWHLSGAESFYLVPSWLYIQSLH